MFKEQLKAARLTKNYSQKQLAEILNTTKAIIGHYEQGSLIPSLDSLVRLSDALDVTTDFLLGIEKYVDSSEANRLNSPMIYEKMLDYLLEQGQFPIKISAGGLGNDI